MPHDSTALCSSDCPASGSVFFASHHRLPLYMQPEPFNQSNTILSTSIFQANQQQPSQHGLDNDANQLPSPLPCGERQGPSTPRIVGAETAPAAVAVINAAWGTPSRRLSADLPLNGRSPVDRIAEYESAMLQTIPRKDQGPRFRVVQMNPKRSNSSSAITGFANGQ